MIEKQEMADDIMAALCELCRALEVAAAAPMALVFEDQRDALKLKTLFASTSPYRDMPSLPRPFNLTVYGVRLEDKEEFLSKENSAAWQRNRTAQGGGG